MSRNVKRALLTALAAALVALATAFGVRLEIPAALIEQLAGPEAPITVPADPATLLDGSDELVEPLTQNTNPYDETYVGEYTPRLWLQA